MSEIKPPYGSSAVNEAEAQREIGIVAVFVLAAVLGVSTYQVRDALRDLLSDEGLEELTMLSQKEAELTPEIRRLMLSLIPLELLQHEVRRRTSFGL